MSANYTLFLVLGYFAILFIISLFTGKNTDNKTFFTGNRNSPWYLVAFGMIGASLSGVTFISVPGWVGASSFSYLQMVLGYMLGYFIIITFLLPLYYRMNLVSIYTYLEERFGFWAYKTGAFYFLVSRLVGSALRLFLVVGVFQISISDHYGIPYWGTVFISIGLIWIYTFRSGIKTIVWTDTFQTFFMLLSVGMTIWLIKEELDWSFGQMVFEIYNSDFSDTFFWKWDEKTFFPNQFLSGALVAVVMTGLDQDMMQKNLTCRSLKDAQKNMWSLSISLVFVNILFLSLGVLLFIFAQKFSIDTGGDAIFTTIALKHLSPLVGVFFVLGVIAAAYSSADSALAALTTSFCVDFLNFEKGKSSEKVRMMVHIGFSFAMFLAIIIFNEITKGSNNSVIDNVFTAAGYTYGPLFGLFSFGIFTKHKIADNFGVLVVCILAPLASYAISETLLAQKINLGYITLLMNGMLTFFGLWILSKMFKSSDQA